MLRSAVITALQTYLAGTYEGPVVIHTSESAETIAPPYAVIRIGASENIGGGQLDIWDFNVLVAVFHDAEATPIETAEAQAGELFAALADPDTVATGLTEIVVSHWERITVEASMAESNWLHVAGYQLIAAPPED